MAEVLVLLLWLPEEDDCLVLVPSLRVVEPVLLLLTVEEVLLVVVPVFAEELPVLLLWVAVVDDWRVVPAAPEVPWEDLLVAVPVAVFVPVPA